MIIAKDEIIYDDEEQKEEVEAETAKSENTEEEYLKHILKKKENGNSSELFPFVKRYIPKYLNKLTSYKSIQHKF